MTLICVNRGLTRPDRQCNHEAEPCLSPLKNSLFGWIARGETAVETFPGSATCCHPLPLSLLEWLDRGRLSPYNRHPARNRLPANAGAGRPLQALQPFNSVAL
jgi:hypothetical protein